MRKSNPNSAISNSLLACSPSIAQLIKRAFLLESSEFNSPRHGPGAGVPPDEVLGLITSAGRPASRRRIADRLGRASARTQALPSRSVTVASSTSGSVHPLVAWSLRPAAVDLRSTLPPATWRGSQPPPSLSAHSLGSPRPTQSLAYPPPSSSTGPHGRGELSPSPQFTRRQCAKIRRLSVPHLKPHLNANSPRWNPTSPPLGSPPDEPRGRPPPATLTVTEHVDLSNVLCLVTPELILFNQFATPVVRATFLYFS